jgi:hypothetical protein
MSHIAADERIAWAAACSGRVLVFQCTGRRDAVAAGLSTGSDDMVPLIFASSGRGSVSWARRAALPTADATATCDHEKEYDRPPGGDAPVGRGYLRRRSDALGAEACERVPALEAGLEAVLLKEKLEHASFPPTKLRPDPCAWWHRHLAALGAHVARRPLLLGKFCVLGRR